MSEIKFDFSLPWEKFKEVYAFTGLARRDLYNKWYFQYSWNREKVLSYKRNKYQEDRDKILAEKKERYKNNKDIYKQRRKKYKKSAEALEHEKQYAKQYRKDNKEKYKNVIKRCKEKKWYTWIHSKVEYEVKKRGIRPQKCPICWWWWTIDAHHPDYNKWNEVVFACHSCHSKIHSWLIDCPTPIDILSINNIKWD